MVAAVAAANVCGQVRWDHEDGSHFGTTCISFLDEEIDRNRVLQIKCW